MARSTELVRSGGKGTVPVQFDLFGTDSRALTNTIALWDVAPRGVFRLDMARGEEAGPSYGRQLSRPWSSMHRPFRQLIPPPSWQPSGYSKRFCSIRAAAATSHQLFSTR